MHETCLPVGGAVLSRMAGAPFPPPPFPPNLLSLFHLPTLLLLKQLPFADDQGRLRYTRMANVVCGQPLLPPYHPPIPQPSNASPSVSSPYQVISHIKVLLC